MSAILKSLAFKIETETFWRHVEQPGGDDCWTWTLSKSEHGYGQLRVDGKMTSTHRRAWVLANGPIPDGMSVCHHCDNPPCVRPDHLFLGSSADNMADMAKKDRGGARRLSNADVAIIRQRLSLGRSQKALASEFGVDSTTISKIATGESRRHVANAVEASARASAKKEGRLYCTRGEVHNIAEWARIVGIKHNTIRMRMKKFGWTLDEALGFAERMAK